MFLFAPCFTSSPHRTLLCLSSAVISELQYCREKTEGCDPFYDSLQTSQQLPHSIPLLYLSPSFHILFFSLTLCFSLCVCVCVCCSCLFLQLHSHVPFLSFPFVFHFVFVLFFCFLCFGALEVVMRPIGAHVILER